MHPRAIGPFVSSLFAASLAAQTPAPAPTPATPVPSSESQRGTGNVDDQVAEMRRQMTEGKSFRSHVRVTVRLKNGNRLAGIVKDGFVVERIDGIRFVAAEASEPGAGIRLMYWNRKGSYVFLPFTDIQEYRINARVTAQELAVIEKEQKAREAEDREQQLAANRDAATQAVAQAQQNAGPQPAPIAEGPAPMPMPPAPPAQQPATPGAPGAGGVSSELQTLYTLIQDFPPAAGWSQQRRDEIAHRQAVVGAKPTAQEQRFVDNFADWQRACALFGAKPVTPAGGDEGTDEGKGRSRRGKK